MNATSSSLNPGNSGFYVNPIRNASIGSNNNILYYDSSANEIKYDTTKTFVIDHPDDKEKYLVHACLEGPEAGVYYRGKGEITNNQSITIDLPPYVKNLAQEFTVQITPIYNGSIKVYNSSEVENNKFNVHGENGKFFWEVKGKRFDIDVEPSKSTTEVKGDGPYKWI